MDLNSYTNRSSVQFSFHVTAGNISGLKDEISSHIFHTYKSFYILEHYTNSKTNNFIGPHVIIQIYCGLWIELARSAWHFHLYICFFCLFVLNLAIYVVCIQFIHNLQGFSKKKAGYSA